MALLGCKREAKPTDSIIGCHAVTESRDPRYERGDRVCLLPRALVVYSTRSGEEAFEVDWNVTGNDFHAVVPPERTRGARVELLVTRLADGKLDFRAASQDWMKVRLEGSAAPEGQELIERLDACHACVEEAARVGGEDSVPPSPIYSLRSCTSFLRVTGAPCAALGMKGR